MPTQDKIFAKEGDKWFTRNNYETGREYEVINYLKLQNYFKPKNVLDIGCSNGKKLNQILILYSKKIRCSGLDPSKLAISKGKKEFPGLELHQGFSHDLGIFKDDCFDLIIMSFVWHWIDRKKIFQTAAEVDRVLKNKGRLIVLDFAPPFPCKVKYHHLPKQKVYTFKQPYWDFFTASQMYSLIYLEEFQHDNNARLDNRNLCKMAVLEKRAEGNYPLV